MNDAAHTRPPASVPFGIIDPQVLASRSGLDLLQAMLRGELPSPPIAQTLGFRLVEAEHGRVAFEGTPVHAHYNPLGTVHGGYHATLLDSALACAVHSTLDAGTVYTTLELKVNLVRALTDRVGPVRAEGRVIHAGRQAATAEARLVDAQGKLYSHATTTCLVFSARAPATK